MSADHSEARERARQDCVAITWQRTAAGMDYVACEGPAVECIIVGLFRHEHAPLCSAHQKHFSTKERWIVFDAASRKVVSWSGRQRVLLGKGTWGWREQHDAALKQIGPRVHKGDS